MERTNLDKVKKDLKDRKNAHVMLVDGMSKLKTHNVNSCQSSVFHISDLKWKLIVYPAGKDGKKEYLSMYVRIKDKNSLPANWEVKCNLKLSIFDQRKGAQEWHSIERPVCYSAKDGLHGKDNFMLHTTFENGYLVNNKAFFSVEISNVKTNFQVTNPPHRTIGTSELLKLSDIPRNKSRFTWKITQFSSFDGDCHSSYEFTAGPRRWKILMYPKGVLDGKGNSLSLFLEATDYLTNGPKAKTLAVFKLRILDQLHRNHYERTLRDWFHHDPAAITRNWGRDKYISFGELKDSSRGFLVNDQIYIGVEFLLLSTTESL